MDESTSVERMTENLEAEIEQIQARQQIDKVKAVDSRQIGIESRPRSS